MSASKWPRLSFEIAKDWSQHATSLQGDFDSLRTYLDSNQDKDVPKYLFKILHASYSSLNGKLKAAKSSVVDSNETSIGTPAETCFEELLDHATAEAVIASRYKSDEDSESGSELENESETETETEIEEHGTEQDNATQANKEKEGSTEETDNSSDDTLPDEADTTVSDPPSREEAHVVNPGCLLEAALSLTVPVISPYLVRHFRKISSARLLRACAAAIRESNLFSIPFIDSELVSKVEHLEDGNIRIFVQNSTNLQILTKSDVWKRVFLANATKAMPSYGVVAAVTRNPRTVLKHKQNDHQRTSLFNENAPRLTAFNGPSDIKKLRWLRKNRGKPSFLLVDFATPEVANEVIKQGFTWIGVTHHCVRYISEARMRSCDNCLAYGHKEKQCNVKPRCYKCGASHSSSLCSSKQLTCPTCSVEHSANIRCLKRFAEQRDYRRAIVCQKPYYRVYADRDDYVTAKAANRICSGSPIPSKSASEMRSHVTPSRGKAGSRANITGRLIDQSRSSESEESSDTGLDHEVEYVQSGNPKDVRCNATTIEPDEQHDSSDSEQTSGIETEQERKEEEGTYSSVQADAVANLGKATDSCSSESTEDSSETDHGAMSETEKKQLHTSADVSKIPDQVGGSSDHQKASKSIVAHEVRRERVVDRSTALTDALPTAPEKQIHSLKPTMTLPTELKGEVLGKENQTLDAAAIDAVSTTPNIPTNPSGLQWIPRPEPKECVRHGENSKQVAVSTDIEPAASLQPTEPSEPTRIRQPRPEDEDEHYGKLGQEDLQTNAPAIGPPTTSSEVDLDSIPLPDDTESIIGQLERLKAIVLARSKLRGGLDNQMIGEKRKASEPLCALSENSRTITPKRVK